MTVKPPPLPLSKSERNGRLLFFGALTLAVLLLVFWPGKSTPGSFCVFQAATGLPCGLCGGTRALRATFHGDFSTALYFNPAALIIAAGAGGIALVLLAEALLARVILPPLKGRYRIAVLALLLAMLVPWTAWHAYSALTTPKPELIVPGHPFVRFLKGD